MNRLFCTGLLLLAAVSVRGAHDWDGSPVLPVHRIPLMDENGVKILAGTESAMPISPRATCIQCHDYGTISRGWHFNPMADLQGRAAEPWVLVDEKSGTQIPLSHRGADGTWLPQAIGMSDWDFVKQFGRHLPGGGPGERERNNPDPHARWTVSGDLEVNCFACHNTAAHQDMTEWVKQIARENFRWAATAAACLGEVEGVAARLPATWNPSDGVNPDDLVWRAPPAVTYPPALFDSKNRAVLDLGKPTDSRCLQCHAVAEVGRAKHHVAGDVHTAAGMSCVDCHRNGIDHNIDRGLEGPYSCRGCHLGGEHGETLAGTHGAPVPAHKGLPPIHLEKLACTACHSGVATDGEPAVVRTARINRLGIHGQAQWMTEAPVVVEPVFKKDGNGRLAPHRMMWPAFWARQQGNDLTPIEPAAVMELGGDMLDPALAVARVLATLGRIKDDDGNPYGQAVFVSGDTVYQANVDGGLDPVGGDLEAGGIAAFAYVVDGQLRPLAEPYPAAEANAFYYQDESRQEHIINLLAALADLAPEDAYPAWILQGKLHKLVNATYAPVPQEELVALRETATKAKADVDALALKLDVAAEVDGTKQKFYRKSDKTELKASKSKTPELYQLKLLMKAQGKAEAQLSELEIIGDKAYRNTFQKNTSRYPVIKDLAGSDTNRSAWVWMTADGAIPLVPQYVSDFVAETPRGDLTVLSERQVAMVLKELGDDAVYVSSGKLFSRAPDGELTVTTHPSAEPVAWPLGHDVRPTAQSLGVKSCKDCHAADAPFFFADVTPQGPLQSDKVASAAMVSFMGMDAGFNRLFGLSFTARSLFKGAMLALVVITALVALSFLLSMLRTLVGPDERTKLARASLLLGGAATAVLAVTGFGGTWRGHLGGYPLLLHTAAGALFALCLAAGALILARDHNTRGLKSLCFWILCITGIALIVSILVAMVPLLGTAAQHTALTVHTVSAVVFVLTAALYAIISRRP